LWKAALQEMAHHLVLTLRVCHFPPRTSKRNKVEHRLFSFITQNWHDIVVVLEDLLRDAVAGDSMAGMRWTHKSIRKRGLPVISSWNLLNHSWARTAGSREKSARLSGGLTQRHRTHQTDSAA
jgi:hypothetical protein